MSSNERSTSAKEDSPSFIFCSAARFFSGTAMSRLTGLWREMAMAFVFGTEEAIANFMVAFRLAHLFRRLLGEGALQTAFIPHFEELRKQSPECAYGFFLNLYKALSLFLLLLISVISAFLGFFLRKGNFTAGNEEILLLTLFMMPSLLFICLFGLNAALLQCEKHFFVPGAAPIAFNLVWILAVFVLWQWAPSQPMVYLSLAVIVACCCQWLITLPLTYKSLRFYPVERKSWKKLFSSTSELRKMAFPLLCGIVGTAAAQINNALDGLFAHYAGGEGPAFLWYSLRLQQLPLALFGIALSNALLPSLSRAVKRGDRASYCLFFDAAINRTASLMLPMTAVLFALGDVGVACVYGRGQFGAASIAATTTCLWGYSLGLIPMALVLIYAPFFYAQGSYRQPALASSCAVLLNIFLNALFIMKWQWGAASVAVATSISAWFNCLWLAFAQRKEQKEWFISQATWLNISKIVLLSAAAMATIFFFRWMLDF